MPLALRLTIENETKLADGGPLSVMVTGKRGIDIGRDKHLDWTLPDPSRTISSKHCEVRYQDDGYMLYDVSTNGTYLDGKDSRLQGPHRLRNGDRLVIGHYIIGVAIEGQADAPQAVAPTAPAYQNLWDATGDAAPPVDRSQVQAPRERPAPVRPDFLDWSTDVPNVGEAAFEPQRPPPRDILPPPREVPPQPSADEASWARGTEKPEPVPEEPPPIPSPRRPVWVAGEPGGPWAAGAAPQAQPEQESVLPAEQTLPPEPTPQSPPVPTYSPPPAMPMASTGAASDFARLIAQGAAVPPEFFAHKSPEELAQLLGVLVRLVAENMMQLLNARLQAKRMARSSNQTIVQAFDNNPLKFSPSAEDALRVMFGPPTRSYLDARRTLEQSFADLKTHQIKTFSAMQQALVMLVEDLDPQAIDHSTDSDRGITALMASRKAKLWDAYVALWQAKTRRYEGGLIDLFMDYFAECYDRSNEVR